MKKTLLTSGLLASVLSMTTIAAEGFRINETIMVDDLSRYTVIEDVSAVYANPAALTQLGGMQIGTNLHGIFIDTELTNKGGSTDTFGASVDALKDKQNPFDAAFVPNLYASYAMDKWRFGFGINSTFGLKNEYDADQFNIFDSRKSDLLTLNFAPVVAYKVNDHVSVAAGLDVTYMDAELVFNPRAGSLGAAVTQSFEGDDISIGGQLGVLIKPADGVKIGLGYHSRQKHNLKGVSKGPFPSANAKAKLTTPDQISASVEAKVMDDLHLSATFRYMVWNVFDKITTSFLPETLDFNYENAFNIAVGGRYKVMEDLELKLGYMYEDTPTVKAFRTSSVPDSNRHWINMGVDYKISDSYSVKFAYAHVFYEDTEIDRNVGLSRLNADVEGSADILTLGFRAKF